MARDSHAGGVMSGDYQTEGPSREEIDATRGPLLLEFGTPWCGHCQAAAPAIKAALGAYPSIQHVKVEDGPGRRLGRSFSVKLWPTLVGLKDGVEVTRLVRPTAAETIRLALAQLV
jgi:thioredoxin 1